MTDTKPTETKPKPEEQKIYNGPVEKAKTEIMPFRPPNRGKKLKVLHDQPFANLNSRPCLWQSYQQDEQTEVVLINEFVNIGQRRAIVRKRTRKGQITIEEDPYNLVRIENIWRLPEKPEDLLQIEPIRNTFRSRYTQLLSKEFMHMVEEVSPLYRTLLALSVILENERDQETQYLTRLKASEFDDFHATTITLTAVTNEYIERLHDIRRLLIKAHLQKKALAMRLNL